MLETLESDDVDQLGEIYVGTLGMNDPVGWAQTNRGESGVNLTLELWPSDLHINLVAWLDAERLLFEHWIAQAQARQALAALVGFELIVFSRRAHKGPSGKPYWQRETFREVARFDQAALARDRLSGQVNAQVAALDPTWEKPAYHLRRAWDREAVVGKGEDLVPELAAAAKGLIPVLQHVNLAGVQSGA